MGDSEDRVAYATARQAGFTAQEAGDYSLALGLQREAEKYVEKFGDIEEQSKVVLNIARCLYQLCAFNLAQDFVKKAIKLTPEWFRPYQVKGIILEKVDKKAGAITAYNKALQLIPNGKDDIVYRKIENAARQIELSWERQRDYEKNNGIDPSSREVKLQTTPIFAALPDLKVFYDVDPVYDLHHLKVAKVVKPKESEQPMLHRLLYDFCEDYTIPKAFQKFETNHEFLFSPEDRKKFVHKKILKLCRERRRVVKDFPTINVNSSYIQWEIRSYKGKDVWEGHTILVISCCEDVQNFHVCTTKEAEDLGSALNMLIRITIRRSLNHRDETLTAPLSITVVLDPESFEMANLVSGLIGTEVGDLSMEFFFRHPNGTTYPELSQVMVEQDFGWDHNIHLIEAPTVEAPVELW